MAATTTTTSIGGYYCTATADIDNVEIDNTYRINSFVIFNKG
jgi:hypothetical protein